MNRVTKFTFLFLLVAALLLGLPSRVSAQAPDGEDSPVIFGSSYTLTAGQSIKDLVVFGGNVKLENGSLVTGDVVVFGGNVTVSGVVRGDVTTFGGDVRVTSVAVISGDLNTIGGSSQIDSGAAVVGSRITGVNSLPVRVPNRLSSPREWLDMGAGAGILAAVFSAFVLALLAMLITVFLPTPADRVAQTIANQPIISGAIGLLTVIIAPALTLVLGITIILIPLGIIGVILFVIAGLFGWIAIGLELGKRLAALTHSTWAIPVSAGIGTLLLSLAAGLIVAFTAEWFVTLCCVALPLLLILGVMGLGGVVTSKFGSQVYSPNFNRPAPVPTDQPGVYPTIPAYPATPQPDYPSVPFFPPEPSSTPAPEQPSQAPEEPPQPPAE